MSTGIDSLSLARVCENQKEKKEEDERRGGHTKLQICAKVFEHVQPLRALPPFPSPSPSLPLSPSLPPSPSLAFSLSPSLYLDSVAHILAGLGDEISLV